MLILDINGKEIKPGDWVIFSLEGDIYEGKVISFSGKYAPTAKISYVDRRFKRAVLAAIKLIKSANRRRVTEKDGEQYFRTYRLVFLSRPQEAQETSQNSLQVETQVAEKNSQEASGSTCLICDGTGKEAGQGPWSSFTTRCRWCQGTGIYIPPAECNPRHGSLDEALGCNHCQTVILRLQNHKAALRKKFGRATPESPCEECGSTEGHYIDD